MVTEGRVPESFAAAHVSTTAFTNESEAYGGVMSSRSPVADLERGGESVKDTKLANNGVGEEVVELDDWGLPIRRKPARMLVEEDSEEEFEDAEEDVAGAQDQGQAQDVDSNDRVDMDQTKISERDTLDVRKTRTTQDTSAELASFAQQIGTSEHSAQKVEPRTPDPSEMPSDNLSNPITPTTKSPSLARPSSSAGRPRSSHSNTNSPASKTMARFASSEQAKAAQLAANRERELERMKAAWSDTVPKQKSAVEARLHAERAGEVKEKRPVTPRKTRDGFAVSPTAGQLEWEQDKGAAGLISQSGKGRVRRSTIGVEDGLGINSSRDVATKIEDSEAVESQAEIPHTQDISESSTAASDTKHQTHTRKISNVSFRSNADSINSAPGASEWSHQQLAPMREVLPGEEVEPSEEDDWQPMPAYAPFNLYNDDGKLIAIEHEEDAEQENYNKQLGGAGKGYTRVQMDDDAQSATSMDENTAYLFKEPSSNLLDEDEEGRDVVSQMQTTKAILTEGQRIAYVGIVRLGMLEVNRELDTLEVNRHTKKLISSAKESGTMWSQKIMVRLYGHMEIESAGM